MRDYVALRGASDEPRPEDFGVTSRDVEGAPRPVIASHRPLVLTVLYFGALAVIFAVVLETSASLPAALVFSVILGAAGSIVLVPLLVCLLCATEKVEARWLCRRFPALESCLAYRESIEEHRRRARRPPEEIRDREWWAGLEGPMLRFQVERVFERANLGLVPVADRELDGYDFTLDGERGRVLVRCQEGDGPIAIGVGRELIACLDETGAARAMLVTAATPSESLASYLRGRPVEVVRPWEIAGELST